MYYKNKTPYGAKIICVTEIVPENEGRKNDYDRVYHADLCTSHTTYMYRDAFERNYEPLSEDNFCQHCGGITIDGIVGQTPKGKQNACIGNT